MNEQPTSEAIGHEQDTGLVVERSVSIPLKDVWDGLMTRKGAEALLGEGGELGLKGESWEAVDGSRGVIRSFHPMEQIRFTWRADADAPSTLVELDLTREGEDATHLKFTQTKLDASADREALRAKWDQVLDRIAATAGE